MEAGMNDWLIDRDGDYVAVAHITAAVAYFDEDDDTWFMKVQVVNGNIFTLVGSWETAQQARAAFGELMRSFVTEDDRA